MSHNTKPPLAAETLALLHEDQPESTISRDERGDQRFRYIKASTAITLANLAFGIGGWSTKVISIEPVRTHQDRVIGYSAIVRVTIHENGAAYEDVGTNALAGLNDGDDRDANAMIAHDVARKGAVSDALKRCLRHLGQMMGNNLYENSADRSEVANAALDRLDPIIGKEKAEDAVFGTKYHRTSEIPLHHSLRLLLTPPDLQPEAPAEPPESPATTERHQEHDNQT